MAKTNYESCRPFVGFHATKQDFETFEPGVGGAQFHVGTASQATMRGGGEGSVLLRVSIYATTLIRKKDITGGGWKRPTKKEADAADGVVYLNRFEGVPAERLSALEGKSTESLSDAEFRRLVPEARDSYGIFQPHNCRIIERIEWMSDRHKQLLEYDRNSRLELSEQSGLFPLAITQDAIDRAKSFCLEKWKERWRDRHPNGPTWTAICGWDYEPEDLSSSCKFTSLFAREVFGGEILGNSDHQFVRLHNGSILDLNAEAADVREMDDPYEIDLDFFGSPDHAESMESCLPRVQAWVEEFSKQVKALLLTKKRVQVNAPAPVSSQKGVSPSPSSSM